MKRLILFGALAMGAMLLTQTAQAACGMAKTAEKPAICSMREFTADTNYMSLRGYLRWQEFKQQHAWIPQEQATRMTEAQTRVCKVQ